MLGIGRSERTKPDRVIPPIDLIDAASGSGCGGHFVSRILPGCRICLAYELGVCAAASAGAGVEQSVVTLPARRIVCREQDLLNALPIICEGWAFCAVMLFDGSRQILSFLLPGDPVSTSLLFAAKPNCFVETVTPVTYRLFSRSGMREEAFATPHALDTFSRVRLEEQSRSDALIADLGRRKADERVARLILGLMQRLQQRGMVAVDPPAFDFPLRLHHIADATGLTPVHVSKVLSGFRGDGLIRLSRRSLAVLDTAGLACIAHLR
jgi:CRP/FNR family transcriptional regulator